MTDERNDIRDRLHAVVGQQASMLERFGDRLAKEKGYREHEGIEAVRYFLMQKHNWLPSQVRALSTEDLIFAISEDWASASKSRSPIGILNEG